MSLMENSDGGWLEKSDASLRSSSIQPATHKSPTLAIRVSRANPNHHLWTNGRLWWLHFTIHSADYKKHRIRRSLNTTNLFVARQRRDAVLSEYTANGTSDNAVKLELSFTDTEFSIPVKK